MTNFKPNCAECKMCESTLLSGLDANQLHELSEKKGWLAIKKGESVFNEGATPAGLFCLYDGSVKVTKIEDDGNEQIVRLAKRGSLIGYRALLCNDVYHASAVAIEDIHVCFLDKETYLKLLYSNPKIAAHTIQTLTSDLRFAENMMMNIACKHAKGRIAEIILILEEFYGVYEKDNTIKTTLKREDIGHLAGTTTETSIRVLSDLSKEGTIELVGKRFRIKNREKLIKLSNRHEKISKR